MTEKNNDNSTGAASSAFNLEIKCPCCQTRIIVDNGTGGIIKYYEPVKEKNSLNALVGKYQQKQSGRADAFQKAFKDEHLRKKLIEEKFKHAKEHIDELDEPDSPYGKD